MKETLTEQYCRTDFETSKLVKQAGFDLPCVAFTFVDGLNENRIFYGSPINHNADQSPFEPKISIPLISIVLEWLKDKGYYVDYQVYLDDDDSGAMGMYHCNFYHGAELLAEKFFQNERQEQFDFIRTVCNHILTKD